MKKLLILLPLIAAGAFLIYRNFVSEGTPVDIISPIVTPIINPISDIISGESTPTINIDYLRKQRYESPAPTIEQELAAGSSYKRYIASYISEGNKIYGLLTVPNAEMPEGGFPAIVFNHGYIPPTQYATTERYIAYVDSLARSGFVVFKIDMRGHGRSEGEPSGSYFSPGYMTDALIALSSLQKMENVNPDRIGMWGHSMSGNLILRAMLVSDQIKAGVIWAGAVYSYEDFAEYRLSDASYRPRPQTSSQPQSASQSQQPEQIRDLRENPENLDFNDSFWRGISLTQNLKYLEAPIQIHHSINDATVNIGYSRDLKKAMDAQGKDLELYEYAGGGHNIDSPYFEQAMQRTVEFFRKNL